MGEKKSKNFKTYLIGFKLELRYFIGQNFGGQNYRQTKTFGENFLAQTRNFGSFVHREGS